ncbi:MAG TPA: helix-turn-helix transcriptional regulator [Verrucomicrobiae bacterium]|nr:helix-turn-helix transcriptional regulator [Verrucomicrobiae bacterium]
MKNLIAEFQDRLAGKVPESAVKLDASESGDQRWLEIRARNKRLTLEYLAKTGFGIFRRNAGFGEGPAEVYRTAELAADRVAQLIASGKKRRETLSLKDLRELYGCSQVQLADKIVVQQAAISRFEQRSEVKLGTLAAAVKALGGELEVRAHFRDCDVPISLND